ncbi:MAG: hypothetical protein AAFV43_14520 [Planctomycetota bacterium]
MSNRLITTVAWTLLAQVLLVAGMGTGLHRLFGCEHGSCESVCCVDTVEPLSDGHDCSFCRRAATNNAASPAAASAEAGVAAVKQAGCDGCAVCDLLAQYHSATPFEFDRLTIEVAHAESAVQRQNAVVAAAIRLALSRGPPAV